MFDSKPIDTYTHLVKELDKRGIAYIQFMEASAGPSLSTDIPSATEQIPHVCKQFREYFKGTFIINNGLTPETAIQKINDGEADAASFAKYYVSNPDLVERIKNNHPYNTAWVYKTMFGGSAEGYTDYPNYDPKNEKSFVLPKKE